MIVRPVCGVATSSSHPHQEHDHSDQSPYHRCSSNLYPHKTLPTFTSQIRMSSIDHVHEQETAGGLADQIAIDGSAGSDTDTGEPVKSDTASKDESDAPHHARSNSVKKPTTFKAVSVTKNFLAKAGTPTAPAAKTNGENGASHLTGSTTKADKTQLQTQQSLAPQCHQRLGPGLSPRPPVAPRPQYLNLHTSGLDMEDLVRTQCKYGTGTEVMSCPKMDGPLPSDS